MAKMGIGVIAVLVALAWAFLRAKPVLATEPSTGISTERYQLIVSQWGEGVTWYTPRNGVMFRAGENIKITVEPSLGWHLDHFIVNGETIYAVSPYTVAMRIGGLTIIAVIEPGEST